MNIEKINNDIEKLSNEKMEIQAVLKTSDNGIIIKSLSNEIKKIDLEIRRLNNEILKYNSLKELTIKEILEISKNKDELKDFKSKDDIISKAKFNKKDLNNLISKKELEIVMNELKKDYKNVIPTYHTIMGNKINSGFILINDTNINLLVYKHKFIKGIIKDNELTFEVNYNDDRIYKNPCIEGLNQYLEYIKNTYGIIIPDIYNTNIRILGLLSNIIINIDTGNITFKQVEF